MSNFDETKGRVKEAAGDLTGDKDLKREGKADQTAGKAKEVRRRRQGQGQGRRGQRQGRLQPEDLNLVT